MTSPKQPQRPPTTREVARPAADTVPPLRRATHGRPLSWRNPWTLLLATLAAFQAGIIVTLLFTSESGGSGGADRTSATGTAEPARVAAPGAGVAAPLAAAPTEAMPATPALADAAVTAPGGDRSGELPVEIATPPATRESRPRTVTAPGRDRSGRPRPRPGDPGAPPGVGDAVADPRPDPAAPPSLLEVEIVSEPEGATVRVEGAVWGVTPLSAFLPARRLSISLELDGHRAARVSWSPDSGKRELRATLVPLETP